MPRLRSLSFFAVPLLAFGCLAGDGIDNGSTRGGARGKADDLGSGEPFMDVIFSPQPAEQSHNARVAAILRGMVEQIDTDQGGDGSGRSVDIAMYSFSDGGIKAALADLVARGVSVRMIFEPARTDKGHPAGTKSAGYEDIGIDVRYINKIMHHKFAILDGPRSDAARAETAILVTGSANWSSGAATRYDENTIFQRGNAELVLRMQREFNLLWQGSKDFVWGETDENLQSMAITDDMIAAVDDPSFDADFTSSNFQLRTTSTGPSFRIVPGRNTVADLLVGLIENAQTSIHVSSGHLRSRPVAEALLAWHEAHPDGDLRVYLDGQEYLSSWFHQDQLDEVDACLAAAGTSQTKIQRCWDNGFLFSYQLHQAGVPLRYKYYAYRWDTSYADQMHNKFFLFDGQIVASGSYNLSDNAEHDTMENMRLVHEQSPVGVRLPASRWEKSLLRLLRDLQAHGIAASLAIAGPGGGDPAPLTPAVDLVHGCDQTESAQGSQQATPTEAARQTAIARPTKVVGARLPLSLAGRLSNTATRLGTTVSAVVETAVEEYLSALDRAAFPAPGVAHAGAGAGMARHPRGIVVTVRIPPGDPTAGEGGSGGGQDGTVAGNAGSTDPKSG